MAIETTQSIPTTSPTSRTVRGFAIGAGLASAFLAGLLVATGTADSGVGLTRTGWDLARAGAITFGILAVLAACTYWGVEQVVHRIEEQATRNRCATLAVDDQLSTTRTAIFVAVASVTALTEQQAKSNAQQAEMAKELARVRGRLDATLMEQNELLHRLGQRLAADVDVAYQLGAQSVRD